MANLKNILEQLDKELKKNLFEAPVDLDYGQTGKGSDQKVIIYVKGRNGQQIGGKITLGQGSFTLKGNQIIVSDPKTVKTQIINALIEGGFLKEAVPIVDETGKPVGNDRNIIISKNKIELEAKADRVIVKSAFLA